MEDKIFEREFWKDLIKSPDYKYLLNVFRVHRDDMNKNALQAIGDKKIDDAIRFQAKADDMRIIVDAIENRIKEMED